MVKKVRRREVPDDVVIELYSKKGWFKGVRETARKYGINPNSIYIKAHRKGLTSKRTHFTPEEVQFIKENLGKMPIKYIAESLGKSYWQVYNYIRNHIKKQGAK